MNWDPAATRWLSLRTGINPWVLIAIVVSLLVCTPWIVHLRRQIASLRAQSAAIEAELQGIHQQIHALESLRGQIEGLRAEDEFLNKQFSELLRCCRSADDIPDLEGDFIASAFSSNASNSIATNFYVPQGEHRLEIEFLDASGQKAGTQRFEFDLLPKTGYRLVIRGDKEPGATELDRIELTAGSEEFEDVSHPLAFEGIDFVTLRSWGPGLEDVAFPGEVSDRWSTQQYAPGVLITRYGLQARGGTPSLRVSAWVRSKTPPCANPNDADRLGLFGHKTVYVGGGKFGLPGFQLTPSNKE